MSIDIQITVVDRVGETHLLVAPTDMNLNLMEVCKSYDLSVKGTCGGMAMCASCHCYIESEHVLREASEDEEDMLDQAFFCRRQLQVRLSNIYDARIEWIARCLGPRERISVLNFVEAYSAYVTYISTTQKLMP